MNKSFQESGGTVLSTNWSEVGKEKVSLFQNRLNSSVVDPDPDTVGLASFCRIRIWI
jgi:hypothetical protein